MGTANCSEPKEEKANERFVAIKANVQERRGSGKFAEDCTYAKLKRTFALWFKHEGDVPFPIKRQNPLAQYLDTNHRGDQMQPFPKMLIEEENVATAISRVGGDK